MVELALVVVSTLVVALALSVVTRAARAGRSLKRGGAIWFAVMAMAVIGAMGVFVSEARDARLVGRGLIVLAIVVGFAPVAADQRRGRSDGEDGGQ